ncbi:non-structural maintenance of chromosomes element 4 homolog A-like, partial [Lolium rigidum]|uniref:non-structural maintenance of chromosomes element 4 homolog A-like n=1 Tax=Lolium rigidum TaxID=89674 RepID=UPI001F5C90E9
TVTPASAAAEGAPQALEDRRLLRSRYLAVKSQINDDKDEMARADSAKFSAIFTQVETLHQLVQKPREQIADAEALLDIATSLGASVRSQSALGITPSDLVAGLLKKFGTRADANGEGASLRWGRVGLAASHVFMAVPGCSTMVGPMKAEVKARRKHITRKRTPRPRRNDRPEQLVDPSETGKSDTDRNMAVLFDVLRKYKRARLENLILNRTSFAQTVENIFALSFLVKDGRVEINVNDDGHHIVCPRNAPAASSIAKGKVVYNHFVFRFDFQDWKLMKGIVAEGEELMQHRPSSLSTSGGNNQQEMPMPTHTTPIRKLSRNRGLVMQAQQDEMASPRTLEVMVMEDTHMSPQDKSSVTGRLDVMVIKEEMAKDKKEVFQTYKRRRRPLAQDLVQEFNRVG